MSPIEFVCVGSIIIDDIVYPDGRTDMAVLGGGVTHCAAGVTVWDVRPTVLASIGTGLPPEIQARLERDFDLTYVRYLDLPQIRAWQVFEWDGKRSEIFRVEDYHSFLIDPLPDDVPLAVRDARAVTVLRYADDFLRFREVFGAATILWEPDQYFMVPENLAALQAALPKADIVSPNLLEAGLTYGEKEPETILRRMLDDGAKVVALRMGELGSLVAQQGVPGFLHIPAVPVPKVIDVTGAGNAYCGGFLVGWQRTHDLRLASFYGAVSASFAVETVGVLDATIPNFAHIRDQRLAWLQSQVPG